MCYGICKSIPPVQEKPISCSVRQGRCGYSYRTVEELCDHNPNWKSRNNQGQSGREPNIRSRGDHPAERHAEERHNPNAYPVKSTQPSCGSQWQHQTERSRGRPRYLKDAKKGENDESQSVRHRFRVRAGAGCQSSCDDWHSTLPPDLLVHWQCAERIASLAFTKIANF
jgi:hypothetical protein